MLITCYLRKGIVYVPTMARRASGPIYTDVEPMAISSLDDSIAVRQALRESLKRGNPSQIAIHKRARRHLWF